ncbi:MAG: MMPL family transporter, partial [Epsilonproteobacteria bacterium]|nr:MMPL family transporter [Campylobacterota bacterium]
IKEEFKSYRKLSKQKNHIYIKEIREIIKKYENNAKMHLGGANMISDDMIEFVKYDLEIFGILVFILVVFMLWFIFKELRWVILTLIMSAVSLIITAGIISFVGWEISVVSSNFILLQIILTMPLIIHMIIKYMELVLKYPHWENSKILEFLLKDMGEPAFYVAITNVAGFGSLITSDMVPISDYGWMMSIGAMVYLVVIFIVLPAILMIIGKSEATFIDEKSKVSYIFAHMVEKHKIFIFAIVIIISGVSLIGAKKLYVENSFINYFKQDTQIYKGMKVLDQNLGGTTPLDIIITFKENNASSIETKIASSNKNDALLDDFESEFNSTNDNKKYWLTKEKLAKIQKIHNYLESIPQIGKVLSIATTADVVKILKNGKELDSVDLAYIQNNLSSENKKILIDPYINIEKNQARITTRVIDSDPTLRRDVLIKKINNDLQTILDGKYENAQISNLLVLYNNVLQSLFDSQIKTLGWALFTIFIMFLMLFRDIKLSIIALIANSIPITVLFGTMGYLDIPLDIMTITIAAISVGITVDNTIHYIHTFETELKETNGNYIKSLYNSHRSTGIAMYYAAVIVIVGFSILAISNFMPTVYFGILTVVVMLVAMIGDLLLTPTLLMITKPFKQKIIKKQ